MRGLPSSGREERDACFDGFDARHGRVAEEAGERPCRAGPPLPEVCVQGCKQRYRIRREPEVLGEVCGVLLIGDGPEWYSGGFGKVAPSEVVGSGELQDGAVMLLPAQHDRCRRGEVADRGGGGGCVLRWAMSSPICCPQTTSRARASAIPIFNRRMAQLGPAALTALSSAR